MFGDRKKKLGKFSAIVPRNRSRKDGPKRRKERADAEKREDGSTPERKTADEQSRSLQVKLEKSPFRLADVDEQKRVIHSFVMQTIGKGVARLKEEFQAEPRPTGLTEGNKTFLENHPKGKNRYKDVQCLDATRVILRSKDGDYIHANYVKTPTNERRFICAQAPLDATCADFWAMIHQEGVEAILMLCNLFEKGLKKSSDYFPTELNEEIKFGDYTVRCLDRKDFPLKCKTSADVKQTSLQLEYEGKRLKLKKKHYHWVDWPDRGVPPADLAVIELLKAIGLTKTPIVVHCSAGVGRTGAVVLVQYILEMVLTGQPIGDCITLLRELRQQRHNSVQTPEQYLFVHLLLLNYWLDEKLIDQTGKAHIEKFTKDYNSFTKAQQKDGAK